MGKAEKHAPYIKCLPRPVKFKSFIYISLFFHNLISKAIFSECTDFCLQLCYSEKGKATLSKPFTF